MTIFGDYYERNPFKGPAWSNKGSSLAADRRTLKSPVQMAVTIGIWLACKKGERPLHPTFGCCIRAYMNKPLTMSILKSLKGEIQSEPKELFSEYTVSNLRITVPERNAIDIKVNIGAYPVELLKIRPKSIQGRPDFSGQQRPNPPSSHYAEICRSRIGLMVWFRRNKHFHDHIYIL
ncbi:MAG: hypothetical protein WBN94_13675 [Methanothrix sp.]